MYSQNNKAFNIILTGSLGNIGKPRREALLHTGHTVTVISSNAYRQKGIEALDAKAAIGKMQDATFVAKTFKGADIFYLMETMEAVGDLFHKEVDFIGEITKIGENYKDAVQQSGMKEVIHLSSIA